MRRPATSVTLELARAVDSVERPLEALTAVARLRARLETLEAVHVENALAMGMSWARIAGALGVSKQAAHKRHAGRASRKGEFSGEAGVDRLIVTGRARAAVALSRAEAKALGHDEVGSDHLLLGVLREGGNAAQALGSLGVTLSSARPEVARRRSRGQTPSPERPPVGLDARVALEQSLREAVRLRDEHLGVEHLLLAVVRDESSAGGRVLAALGVPPARVETQLARLPAARD